MSEIKSRKPEKGPEMNFVSNDWKYRFKWIIGFAAVGYALPPIIGSGATWTFSIPFGVVRTLVPLVNLTAQYPVDWDMPALLFFFGPCNAFLYGLLGLFVGQFALTHSDSGDS
jgi:hypothetical protein